MRATRIWTAGGELDLETGPTPQRRAARRTLAGAARHAMAACTSAELGHVADEVARRADRDRPARRGAGARRRRQHRDAATRRRRQMFHFDPRLRLMTTIDDERRARSSSTRRERRRPCSRAATAARRDGERRSPDARERRARAGRALRRIRACACSRSPGDAAARRGRCPSEREDAERELCFLGLVALLRPAAPEVADAVARCHAAGIRIIVDHRRLRPDRSRDRAARRHRAERRDGRDRRGARRDVRARARRCCSTSGAELIFARSSPEAKLRIADALRARVRSSR